MQDFDEVYVKDYEEEYEFDSWSDLAEWCTNAEDEEGFTIDIIEVLQ